MSKHAPSGHTPTTLPADDLKCNPGIHASRGMTMGGGEPEELEGDNTMEGEVANDVNTTGGISAERGRTNK
jgi:hypothetical protein